MKENNTTEALDGRIKKIALWCEVDEPPRVAIGDKGKYLVTKVALSNATLEKIPWVANDDFTSLTEALEELPGSIHLVRWSCDVGPFKALFAKTGFKLGEWLVTTRGISASRWEYEGRTGVKLQFCGFMLKEYGETYSSLDVDMLIEAPETGDDPDADPADLEAAEG